MKRLAAVFGVLVVLGLVYLVSAWLVVMNTDACWWPWHDVLPGTGHLCSIGM